MKTESAYAEEDFLGGWTISVNQLKVRKAQACYEGSVAKINLKIVEYYRNNESQNKD